MEVKVDVEYCGVCDFKRQCHDLKSLLSVMVPEARVTCMEGRRGSFEVQINGQLVHSKLSTMAFPMYNEIAINSQRALEGKEIQKVSEQPITSCLIS